MWGQYRHSKPLSSFCHERRRVIYKTYSTCQVSCFTYLIYLKFYKLYICFPYTNSHQYSQVVQMFLLPISYLLRFGSLLTFAEWIQSALSVMHSTGTTKKHHKTRFITLSGRCIARQEQFDLKHPSHYQHSFITTLGRWCLMQKTSWSKVVAITQL